MNDEVREVTQEESSPMENESSAIVNEDESFLSALSDDLKGEPCLKDFKDVGGLAKSYVNAQRMLGSSIRIPGEEAGDDARKEFIEKLSSVDGVVKLPDFENQEEMDRFFNKLGRPETPDGYDFKFEDGVSVDQEELKGFTSLAHDIGLTQQQAMKLAEFEINRDKEFAASLEAEKERSISVLKDKWGEDFENRKRGAETAAAVLAEKFPEEMKAFLTGPDNNNPAVLYALSELGKFMKEAGHEGAISSVSYGMSAEEAREQIQEIRDNKSHPYHDAGDPGHGAALNKMRKLYVIANS